MPPTVISGVKECSRLMKEEIFGPVTCVVPFRTEEEVSALQCQHITLPMLRLLSSKIQVRKTFQKPSKPCHVGSHWITLTEYSQMSTHLPGLQPFVRLFASFCIGQINHQQHED